MMLCEATRTSKHMSAADVISRVLYVGNLNPSASSSKKFIFKCKIWKEGCSQNAVVQSFRRPKSEVKSSSHRQPPKSRIESIVPYRMLDDWRTRSILAWFYCQPQWTVAKILGDLWQLCDRGFKLYRCTERTGLNNFTDDPFKPLFLVEFRYQAYMSEHFETYSSSQ